jgi:DNA-binding CsgD family transcriptional regulator
LGFEHWKVFLRVDFESGEIATKKIWQHVGATVQDRAHPDSHHGNLDPSRGLKELRMALQEPELLRLIVAAYEAATDPTIWPRFLERYAQAIRADIAFLQCHHLAQHRSELLATFGMMQRFSESYNRHYSRVNVWREHGAHLYAEGAVIVDEEFYPRDLLKRTEFYNDCLLLNGATRCLTGVINRREGEIFVLTAMRAEHGQAFDAAEAKLVEPLVAHLTRARILQEHLQVLESGEMALNALNLGILLIARDGLVVFFNRAADEIVRSDDGLLLRSGRLAASNREPDDGLQKLFRYATAPDESKDCPPGVLVTRPSGRPPFHVTAAPLRCMPRPFIGTTPPAAVVLITDPEKHRPVAADALKGAYGLTAKEATLAIALAEGQPLDQAAEQLHIRYETARTHLRRILSKTETSRQSELVLLLERMSQ